MLCARLSLYLAAHASLYCPSTRTVGHSVGLLKQRQRMLSTTMLEGGSQEKKMSLCFSLLLCARGSINNIRRTQGEFQRVRQGGSCGGGEMERRTK